MLDGAHFRRVLGQYPTGVCVVTAVGRDGEPVGMTVGSFTSVSLDPPLVHVCIDAGSSTREQLFTAPRIGVSVLAQEQAELCRLMGRKGADRFADVPWRAGADGAVFLDGAAAWFDCLRQYEVRLGDHFVEVLEVVGVRQFDSEHPLVFHASGFKRLHHDA